MAEYEGFYASVLNAHFAATGAEVRAEESGSLGRADLCVRAFGRVYVFEFKMKGRAGPEAALSQLKARGYADRYRGLGEPIQLVGVEFSAETRNITGIRGGAGLSVPTHRARPAPGMRTTPSPAVRLACCRPVHPGSRPLALPAGRIAMV